MQNVRSKSTTSPALYRSPQRLAAPAVAMAGRAGTAAPRLRIVPGRVLLFVVVLSAVASLLLPRLAAVASSTAEPRAHVIERGETLWGVAQDAAPDQDPRDYVGRLLRVNGLSSPQVHPGQTLILP
jgi:LysM repeat protein